MGFNVNKPCSFKTMCRALPAILICFSAASSAEGTDKAHAKSGYSVDGRTSASVLAAQRSHEASKEDEIGLSVFSGLFVIALIGVFAQKLFENK